MKHWLKVEKELDDMTNKLNQLKNQKTKPLFVGYFYTYIYETEIKKLRKELNKYVKVTRNRTSNTKRKRRS